jgi:hypothetical protein
VNKNPAKTSSERRIPNLLKLLLALSLVLPFFVQSSMAEKLSFKADDASKEEIATQAFHVDEYRRIYAFIPIDKYDFAKIRVKLLATNVSGVGLFVMNSRYTQQVEFGEGESYFEFIQQPSGYEKRRIEFQIKGKGQVRVEAEVTEIIPDSRFDGEYYNIYLFTQSMDANQGFKGKMMIYSKRSFSTLSYSLKLSYFGREIFEESKSLTSKSKFARGKLSEIELNIPARFFILPGTYSIEMTSNDWKFSKSINVWLSISSVVLFAFIASIVYGGVRYRREMGEWLNSLTVGQKLVLVAILLLIFSALSIAFENEKSANLISILAYYFLVLGVGNLTAEYLLERGRKNEGTEDKVFDPYPEVRGIISLLTLSALIRFTPEILQAFPYLDVAALISAAFLAMLSIRERTRHN